MAIEQELRRKVRYEEFDYQLLLDVLRPYSQPRDKITKLIREGVIIRVKKGLYVFGRDFARRPYSPEILANLVYGPSYLSLDYALSYYGMIPERVESFTSVTSGKNRAFETPVGRFTYQSVAFAYYRVGIDAIETGDGRSFLMATREKALADKVYQREGSDIRSVEDVEAYLLGHLRIDPASLSQLSYPRVAEIAGRSRLKRLSLVSDFVKARQEPS